MSEQIASTFGRRVSTTDYVSLLGRRSVEHISPLPPAATDEQEELLGKRETLAARAELAILLGLALPVVATFSMELLPPIVQVVFLGRLGSQQIAAGALATTYTNVAGLSIGIGLATGMDTLCSQACGANKPRAVGLWLQRATLLLSVAFIPVAMAMWFSGDILIALHQPREISLEAAEFVRLSIPAIYLLWMFEVMKQALQAQGIIRYNLIAASAMNVANLLLCVLLTRNAAVAFQGIAIARSVASLILVGTIMACIHQYRLYADIWPAGGWGWHAMQRWSRFLRFGLPGCIMTCIDWWAFEVLTLITGLLPNPETAMAANMIVFQITSGTFAVFLGLSVAVTIHIGNLLGSGQPARAKKVAHIAAALAVMLGAMACVGLYTFRTTLARAFTTDRDVQGAAASVLPLLAAFNQFDAVITLCFGIFRGTGLQQYGAALNLFTQYVVALPLAVLFGYHWQGGVEGLWLGPTIAKAIAAFLGIIIVSRLDWDQLSRQAVARANEEQHK